MVCSETLGDIIVQGDLTNELFDEYRLLVRAVDQEWRKSEKQIKSLSVLNFGGFFSSSAYVIVFELLGFHPNVLLDLFLVAQGEPALDASALLTVRVEQVAPLKEIHIKLHYNFIKLAL